MIFYLQRYNDRDKNYINYVILYIDIHFCFNSIYMKNFDMRIYFLDMEYYYFFIFG